MRISSFLILLCICTNFVFALENDYPVTPIEFPNVKLKDDFWAPRQEINRKRSIPFAFEQCEKTGRVENFKLVTGEAREGYKYTVPVFNDTDIYKGIEAASFDMAVNPDPEIDAYVDRLIAIVGAAQEEDGYLVTAISCGQDFPDLHSWMGGGKWKNLSMSHELYNAGHLFEAASAHHIATGKRNFLDIAIKLADMLCETFGPNEGQIRDVPGHQVIEMGLVKLYRLTGEKKYLELAKFFVDMRGRHDLRNSLNRNPKAMYGEYSQDHKPLIDQDEAVGHAVRATYFYAGAADVAVLSKDEKSLEALDRIWDNVVSKKLALTGGHGGTPHGEAFARNYELPNFVGETYNETCAQIGGCYWHHRMFLIEPDSKYYDVLERTIYNGLISGVSLDGEKFFYPNPLASYGGYQRAPWFGCACCPQNLMRFLASLGGYVYSLEHLENTPDALYVGLYISNDAKLEIEGQKLEIDMKSGFPNDGNIEIVLHPEEAKEWILALRIPSWALGNPLPSDLYTYTDADREAILKSPPKIKLNGKEIPLHIEKGFVKIKRTWKDGDKITLEIPMPLNRVLCNEKVAANRDRIAFEKGPLVYCFESCDNGGNIFDLVFEPEVVKLETKTKSNEKLKGAREIALDVVRMKRGEDNSYEKETIEAVMVPYCVWGNRGDGQMQVWMARNESSADIPPKHTPATDAKVDSSFARHEMQGRLHLVKDGRYPDRRNRNARQFDWWGNQGTTEWIQYEFEEPETISKSCVYWFDDTGSGNCRIPLSWRLLYKDDEKWKEVVLKKPFRYGIEKDKLHEIEFEPITSNAMRLEVKLQEGFSGGLYEWNLE